MNRFFFNKTFQQKAKMNLFTVLESRNRLSTKLKPRAMRKWRRAAIEDFEKLIFLHMYMFPRKVWVAWTHPQSQRQPSCGITQPMANLSEIVCMHMRQQSEIRTITLPLTLNNSKNNPTKWSTWESQHFTLSGGIERASPLARETMKRYYDWVATWTP